MSAGLLGGCHFNVLYDRSLLTHVGATEAHHASTGVRLFPFEHAQYKYTQFLQPAEQVDLVGSQHTNAPGSACKCNQRSNRSTELSTAKKQQPLSSQAVADNPRMRHCLPLDCSVCAKRMRGRQMYVPPKFYVGEEKDDNTHERIPQPSSQSRRWISLRFI